MVLKALSGVDPCEAELAGCFVPPETELVLKMLA